MPFHEQSSYGGSMDTRQTGKLRLPAWMLGIWAIAIPGLAACAVSASMNLWALIHGGGFILGWGAASFLVLVAWVLTTAAWIARRRARSQAISPIAWWLFAPSAAFVLVLGAWLATGFMWNPLP
jgi:hypothetical protein